MKLISSTPESRHHHRNGPPRGWFLKRFRSRFLSARCIVIATWLLLLLIVGGVAIFVFHSLRQTLETVAGQ